MSKSVVVGPEAEELKKISAALPMARKRADEALEKYGMESREFLEADTAFGKLFRRYHEICRD